MAKDKPAKWISNILIGVTITVLSGILLGGGVFAREMDRKTSRLEQAASTTRKQIKAIKKNADNHESQLTRIERMVNFMAGKAGYIPAEMGRKE